MSIFSKHRRAAADPDQNEQDIVTAAPDLAELTAAIRSLDKLAERNGTHPSGGEPKEMLIPGSRDELLEIIRDPRRLRETVLVGLLRVAQTTESSSQQIAALKAAADIGVVAEDVSYRVMNKSPDVTVNVVNIAARLSQARELALKSANSLPAPALLQNEGELQR